MAVATWGAVCALPLRSSSGNGADGPARGAGEELLCRRKGRAQRETASADAGLSRATMRLLPDQVRILRDSAPQQVEAALCCCGSLFAQTQTVSAQTDCQCGLLSLRVRV
jgi:hypothetical protein